MRNELLSLLPEHPWHDHIHWFDTIDSTNTRAKIMAQQGAPHGTVLIAGHQTGGRGRLGRSFHSPEGSGVYLSVILRPNCQAGDLMHLTCAAAVAMCEAIEKAAPVHAGIKWTNDLLIGKRKLGGVLTELGMDADGKISYAVIGIGINCTQKAEDFPPDIRQIATSLAMASGKDTSRMALAAAMIRELHRMDLSLFTGKRAMLDAYRSRCVTLGNPVSILRGDTVSYAKAVDIDSAGALIVCHEDSHLETVSSGEVSVRGMYGYAGFSSE